MKTSDIDPTIWHRADRETSLPQPVTGKARQVLVMRGVMNPYTGDICFSELLIAWYHDKGFYKNLYVENSYAYDFRSQISGVTHWTDILPFVKQNIEE